MLAVDGNSDSKKCVQILDSNLWHFIAKDFVETAFIFKDDMHWHRITTFHESGKIRIKFIAKSNLAIVRT